MSYTDIILPVPLHGYFTYAIPDDMQGRVDEGMRVLVPFGRNKHYVGIVARLHDEKPQGLFVIIPGQRYNGGASRGGGPMSEVERIRLTHMTEKGG